MKCTPCDKHVRTKIPGVYFPAEFDDRPASADGKVFVTACTTCCRYSSDTCAAEAVAIVTGWPICKSYDRDDDPNYPDGVSTPEDWRPYFAVTMAEALAVGVKP